MQELGFRISPITVAFRAVQTPISNYSLHLIDLVSMFQPCITVHHYSDLVILQKSYLRENICGKCHNPKHPNCTKPSIPRPLQFHLPQPPKLNAASVVRGRPTRGRGVGHSSGAKQQGPNAGSSSSTKRMAGVEAVEGAIGSVR